MQDVCEQLKMSKKKYNRLKHRIKRNNCTIINKRGMNSLITDEHIEFLKKWFSS